MSLRETGSPRVLRNLIWMGVRNPFPSSSGTYDLRQSLFPPPLIFLILQSWEMGISAFRGSSELWALCTGREDNSCPALNQPGIHLQPGTAASLLSWHKHTEQVRQTPLSYLKPHSKRASLIWSSCLNINGKAYSTSNQINDNLRTNQHLGFFFRQFGDVMYNATWLGRST